ncbi:MAG: GlsB/YeaQ/YmgE family stress response membrane protein [Gemmataceae bacterium]
MTTFAAITLDPGGVIAWLAVGLIAGFLAGRVMSGGGYGVIGDLVVGLVGALLGGFLFGQFVTGTPGLIGSIVVAFLGACALIWLLRLVAPNRARV